MTEVTEDGVVEDEDGVARLYDAFTEAAIDIRLRKRQLDQAYKNLFSAVRAAESAGEVHILSDCGDVLWSVIFESEDVPWDPTRDSR